jgi:hypothetical protein
MGCPQVADITASNMEGICEYNENAVDKGGRPALEVELDANNFSWLNLVQLQNI